MVEATKERLDLLGIYSHNLCLTAKNLVYFVTGWETEEKVVKPFFGKPTKRTYITKIYGKFSDNFKDKSISYWDKDDQILTLLADIKDSRRRFQKVKDELKTFGFWITKMSKNDG